MLTWLVPIGLFWIVGAVYLGGFPLAFHGDSGVRQVLGLLATFVAYLLAWTVLRAVLGAMLPGTLGGMMLPTAIVIVLYPWLARAGFLAAGVKIRKGARSAH